MFLNALAFWHPIIDSIGRQTPMTLPDLVRAPDASSTLDRPTLLEAARGYRRPRPPTLVAAVEDLRGLVRATGGSPCRPTRRRSCSSSPIAPRAGSRSPPWPSRPSARGPLRRRPRGPRSQPRGPHDLGGDPPHPGAVQQCATSLPSEVIRAIIAVLPNSTVVDRSDRGPRFRYWQVNASAR